MRIQGVMLVVLPLLQTLLVVIGSSTCLPTLEASSDTRLKTRRSNARIMVPCARGDLFITIEEENALDVHFAVHRLFPTIDIIFIARESIDKEMFFATLGHGLSEREKGELVTRTKNDCSLHSPIVCR